MPRVAAIALAVLAAWAPAASAQDRPALRVLLEDCSTGALPAQRMAGFMGSMPARTRTARMAMRFELERRRGAAGAWRRVTGVPGFGRWERSLAHRAGFVFHKRVDGLAVGVPAPAYRAVVRFRWYDAEGDLQATARRRTAPCRQPDLRPDLAAGTLAASPGPAAGLVRYALTVRNDGRSAAGPFAVRVAGVVTETDRLAAGAARVVEIVAPACAAGASVAVAVDPDGRVDEAVETPGDERRICPVTAP
jgi:hypothetical protein